MRKFRSHFNPIYNYWELQENRSSKFDPEIRCWFTANLPTTVFVTEDEILPYIRTKVEEPFIFNAKEYSTAELKTFKVQFKRTAIQHCSVEIEAETKEEAEEKAHELETPNSILDSDYWETQYWNTPEFESIEEIEE